MAEKSLKVKDIQDDTFQIFIKKGVLFGLLMFAFNWVLGTPISFEEAIILGVFFGFGMAWYSNYIKKKKDDTRNKRVLLKRLGEEDKNIKLAIIIAIVILIIFFIIWVLLGSPV